MSAIVRLSSTATVIASRQLRHSKLCNSGCRATAGRLRTKRIGSLHLEHLGKDLSMIPNKRSEG
jgi:hypothetical protein